MNTAFTPLSQVVEDEVELSLADLCAACQAEREVIVELVSFGVLEPVGRDPADWRFGGPNLRRGRVALRLIRHLEVNVAGVAVAIELIEAVEHLQARLAIEKPRLR